MEYKYKKAREDLGISLRELVSWINDDLREHGKQVTITQLYRIEEGLRKRYDIITMVAEKYYRKIYSRWEKDKQIEELDKKYGG